MKKNIVLGFGIMVATILVTSCNQEPKYPSQEELSQKVQDKYGAELNNLRELRTMECEQGMSDKINAKLNEAAPAQ